MRRDNANTYVMVAKDGGASAVCFASFGMGPEYEFGVEIRVKKLDYRKYLAELQKVWEFTYEELGEVMWRTSLGLRKVPTLWINIKLISGYPELVIIGNLIKALGEYPDALDELPEDFTHHTLLRELGEIARRTPGHAHNDNHLPLGYLGRQLENEGNWTLEQIRDSARKVKAKRGFWYSAFMGKQFDGWFA